MTDKKTTVQINPFILTPRIYELRAQQNKAFVLKAFDGKEWHACKVGDFVNIHQRKYEILSITEVLVVLKAQDENEMGK